MRNKKRKRNNMKGKDTMQLNKNRETKLKRNKKRKEKKYEKIR